MTEIETVEVKIKQLFADVLEISIDAFSESSTPEEIENWDSFKQMFLVASFEEDFDISIEPEEIVEMYITYEAFKNVIIKKISQ